MQSGAIRVPASATEAAAGRIGLKEVGLLGCTLLVCGCLHLLFPDRIENWKSARLGSLLSYPYNTDSGEYAFLVVTFPHGLKEHEARALRPLYPGLAFLVYQPLRLLERWIPEKICRQAAVLTAEGGGASVWKGVDLRDMVTAWAALIVVNVVLYMTSLLLILSSLRRVFPPSLALLLTMVPATQRNAIDFLLVPATDVFNVLLPAIFLYTATALWSKKRGGLATALALGVGVLGKGVLYPFCNWLYEHLAVRDWRRGWRTATALHKLVRAADAALPGAGLADRHDELESRRERRPRPGFHLDDRRPSQGHVRGDSLAVVEQPGHAPETVRGGLARPLGPLRGVGAAERRGSLRPGARFEETPRLLRCGRCRVLCFGAVPLPPPEYLLLSRSSRFAGRPGGAETRPAGRRAAVGSCRPDGRLCRR